MNQATGLISVLEKFLIEISDAKSLILSTFEGVELMTVYRDEIGNDNINQFDKQTIDSLVISYVTSFQQSSKSGMGRSQYSISWMDNGHKLLVHIQLEALIVTLVMEENANLGLLEEHIDLLKKILGPFSNSNFISVTL